MCKTSPCPGCDTCYSELRALIADNRLWRGPFIDPVTPEFGPYVVKRHGYNVHGNYHETRLFGSGYPNRDPYHYDNVNGSRYWKNPDGSSLYDDGQGERFYTEPPTPPLS